MRVIGHRGNGAGPDENTLAGCRRAIKDGADAIELDVRLYRDELVLSHGTPLPTAAKLSSVLPKLEAPAVLHLKRSGFSRRHDRLALARIAKLGHAPGITVSSRWPGTLRHSKRRYPKLRTAFVTQWLGWDRRFAESLGVTEFHAWRRTLTARAIRKAHEAGLPVVVFVPNRPLELRVDGMITDRVKAFAGR